MKKLYVLGGLSLMGLALPALAVRELSAAGIFYPKDPQALLSLVQKDLDKVEREACLLPDSSVIMIVPHAGYLYAGAAASQAYACLKQTTFDHIVLIGPHHEGREGGVSVYWDHQRPSAWRSPFGGTIPIDPLAEILARKLNDPREDAKALHSHEYSLEVQLPFLQVLFPGQPFIPILINSPQEGDRVARACSTLLKDKRVLYVISTDLSRYLLAETAEQRDRATLKMLFKGTAVDFLSYLKKNHESPTCANGAVYMGLRLQEELGLPSLKGCFYAQSLPLGEKDKVVGYASALTQKSFLPPSFKIQKQVIQSIREILNSTFGHQAPPSASFDLPCRGIFVTLKDRKTGLLRGEGGGLREGLSLAETLAKYAQQAAFHDARFPPVTEKELPGLEIEVALLVGLRPVLSYGGIVPDQDGALIRQGSSTAILFPEKWQGIGRESFFKVLLSQKKASGLDFSPTAQWYAFQTFHIKESTVQ